MIRQELEQQYLVVDNMTFTPRFTVAQIEVIENGETILIDDYTLTATAQEVYNEWQAQQNNPITIPTAEERIIELEQQNTMLLECLLEISEVIYA